MKIETGKIKKPFIILCHGTQGVGKSTFAASLERPLFIGTENTDEIDTDRDEKTKSVAHFKEQINYLLTNDHKYKTLVVDAIDGIEQMAVAEIINSDTKTKNPSLNRVHGGYGAGSDMLVKDMLDLRESLQSLRDVKGMNLCILCHTKTKNTIDPVAGATYDEFKLSLSDKTENIWLDWVSAVLFMTDVVEKSDEEKFAFGRGEKIIYTQRRPGSVAKNRYDLPYELEMPIDNPSGPFMEGYNNFFSGVGRTDDEIKMNIKSLVDANIIDKDLAGKVFMSVEKAKNNKSLAAIEKRVIERIG